MGFKLSSSGNFAVEGGDYQTQPLSDTKIIENWEEDGRKPDGWTTNTLSVYDIGTDFGFGDGYGARIADGLLGSSPGDGLDYYIGYTEADRFYFLPRTGSDTLTVYPIYQDPDNCYYIHVESDTSRVEIHRISGGTDELVLDAYGPSGGLTENRWYRIELYFGTSGYNRLRLYFADVHDADDIYYAEGAQDGHSYQEARPAVEPRTRHSYYIDASSLWYTDEHEAFNTGTF